MFLPVCSKSQSLRETTFRRMRKKLALGLRRNVYVSTCYIRTLGFTIHVAFNVDLFVQWYSTYLQFYVYNVHR